MFVSNRDRTSKMHLGNERTVLYFVIAESNEKRRSGHSALLGEEATHLRPLSELSNSSQRAPLFADLVHVQHRIRSPINESSPIIS